MNISKNATAEKKSEVEKKPVAAVKNAPTKTSAKVEVKKAADAPDQATKIKQTIS